jgi:hypothetical protein
MQLSLRASRRDSVNRAAIAIIAPQPFRQSSDLRCYTYIIGRKLDPEQDSRPGSRLRSTGEFYADTTVLRQ